MAQRVPPTFLGRLRVLPNLPESLSGLRDLAYNLYWSWSPHVRALFRSIDKATWIRCNGSPPLFMRIVKQHTLDEAGKNPEIVREYDRVNHHYLEYLSGKKSWWQNTQAASSPDTLIAYFSAEFGLHETLPIYSGGLGVLAGDHCKSASDLGLPFVAVGMLYREGYFIQRIDADGQQRADFEQLDFENLPVQPALDDRGNEVSVDVDLLGRKVHAKVWRAQVGRIPLYLLDTDVPQNGPEDRKITARLYGGDQEMRIQQELVLGIGGVRALRALGRKPTVFHMNEGHSALLTLERLRELLHDEGLDFPSAVEAVRGTSLFTTHTPVPAGNDAFPLGMIERYCRPLWESLGLGRTEFMMLGLEKREDGTPLFGLTVLALNLAGMANGVSELHGEVSRRMWQKVWPDVPPSENPIGSITNGVHTTTWMSLDMQKLLDKYLPGDWRENISDPALWRHTDKIPDHELWATIHEEKGSLIRFVHDRMRYQHERYGESPDQLRELEEVFSQDALTIGFARRFATYKRATLIFRDRDRLKRILNNPERPVQLVFSGKAHPADMPGQQFIRDIHHLSREAGFRNKIVLLEGYDMNVGRRLTSGVDVWLNNPRRPHEASGTSGMKVPLNGGLNCSILDGWWPEAFRRSEAIGWAIGEERHYENTEQQDEADAEAIYEVLENQIAPLFFDRNDEGVPVRWLKRVRESMKTCAPLFSTHRMVEDYARKYYVPGSARHGRLSARKHAGAREFAQWKAEIRRHWPSIRIDATVEGGNPVRTIHVGRKIDIRAEVDLGGISPEDVSVEIFVESLNTTNGSLPEIDRVPMRPEGRTDSGLHLYSGSLREADSGEYGYTVRVVPKHPDLVHPHETGLVKWAGAV